VSAKDGNTPLLKAINAQPRKRVASHINLRTNPTTFGRTVTLGMTNGSTAAVTLERRDWGKVVDALRFAARHLNDPPDSVLLRIARDIERKHQNQS
jgi:hypothetical protein